MAATRTSKKTAIRAPVPATAKSAAKPTTARLTLAQAMNALEKAGSAQTRKTYARHGVSEPMFGVSFATLKTLVKQIGVDHELALELWSTGNHDARVLAVKIADPARIKSTDLDRWAAGSNPRACGNYVAVLAAESPHGAAKARAWLASSKETLRASGWMLAGQLANLDETAGDEWFEELVERIENSIHSAPNAERAAMNTTLIAIGGRSAALRKSAAAAAKRIGKVEIDHGDTACKTPDAVQYLDKMWAHASSKKFASPAAQERARESLRTRC